MSSPDESAKRRVSESTDQVAIARPHKKRFSSGPSSPTTMMEEDQDGSDKDPLEEFQKRAIRRQYKEYLRMQQRWKDRLDRSNRRKSELDALQSTWKNCLKQWRDEVRQQLKEYCPDYVDNDDADYIFKRCLDDKDIADEATLVSSVLEHGHWEDRGGIHWNEVVNRWSRQRQSLLEENVARMHQDHRHALETYIKNRRALVDINKQFRQANAKMLLLLEERRVLQNKKHAYVNLTESVQREIDGVQGRLSKVAVVKPKAEEDQEAEEMLVDSPKKEQTSDSDKTSNDLEAVLLATQQRLAQQIQEIESIMKERITLKQELARLEFDLVKIPEAEVHRAFRQQYDTRDYQQDKVSRLLKYVDEQYGRLNEAMLERRGFVNALEADSQSTTTTESWAPLLKLEQDLTRVRGDRDALETDKEHEKVQDECLKVKSSSLQVHRAFGENLKKRIQALETEVCREKRKWVTKTGLRDLLQSVAHVNDADFSPKSVLEAEISRVEKQVESAKQASFDQHQLTDAIHQDLVAQDWLWASECKRWQEEIHHFKQRYGFDPDSLGEESTALTMLQDRIKAEADSISKRQQEVESREANEAQLVSEIENVLKAYDSGEKECLNRLAAQEAKVIALKQERTRYLETFNALNKSKDVHTKVVFALKKQTEKQLEHIKQLNEREKNLHQQLRSLDRVVKAAEAAIAIISDKNTEADKTLKDFDEKANTAKGVIKELEVSILEKIRLTEENAHARLRQEETNELLRRKVDVVNKAEKPAEAKLRKEKEEYRALLNCSSCHSRLKSHVLMRCMHMFCKECLDTLVGTRQRRCPKCGESFGVNDMKPFYYN